MEVLRTYPQLRVRGTPTGLWISGIVQPVQDLEDRAILVVLVPNRDAGRIRAWAWWTDGVWVGPRHTNYGDGSICAYEPSDDSWRWEMGR